ncbi:E3 ubiquitin-protein ligase IAP-3, partial [Frankliniella fusca]
MSNIILVQHFSGYPNDDPASVSRMSDEAETGVRRLLPEIATLGAAIFFRAEETEKWECGIYKDGYNPLRTNDLMYKMGVCTKYGKVHPQYKLKASRLKTFEGWPKETMISGEKMADAGLFWTSTDDMVICFWCGGGLKDWDADDDPWVNHAKWFGRCSYLLERKGIDFVQNVHEQLDTAGEVVVNTSMTEVKNMDTS